ncbi:MAG TPA: MBL fold metallo-hydrolase [Octadecabacter sp.]|nr:MBL fold metallo-hydrolase [Octadecabacter sp.]
MNFSRRKLLSIGTAGLAGSLLPYTPLMAQTKIGEFTLTSLSDGSLTLPASLVLGPIPEDARAGAIAEFGLGEVLTPPCNVTLLQTGDRNILFDVGAGSEFMSSAGFLLDALDDIGLAPEEITDIAFTHAHPDHLWGLVDDFDDLLFPNARYMIGQTEWDYWTNPETVDTIDKGRTTFAVGAARRLSRIEDNITFFKDGEEVLPGVAARATFGHTPGHMAFEVRQGANAMMILGDSIGNGHIALAHPDWKTGSDQNMDMGAATRRSLLDQITHDQIAVLGFHLPGDGVGHIERAGDGYRFSPV